MSTHRRSRSNPISTTLDMGSASSNNVAKVIRVPIPTFPPTAMVYSVNKVSEESLPLTYNGQSQSDSNGSPDYVSAAIMAKVLEERDKERRYMKTQKCNQCRNRRAYVQYIDDQTQTTNAVLSNEDYHYSNSIPNRQRSESSSSMESINIGNSTHNSCNSLRSCNETIII